MSHMMTDPEGTWYKPGKQRTTFGKGKPGRTALKKDTTNVGLKAKNVGPLLQISCLPLNPRLNTTSTHHEG
jgi:hypothetical protein